MSGRLSKAFTLDAADLRASLLTLVLRVTAVLGLLVALPSLYAAAERRMIGVVVLDSAALILVFALLWFDRVPFRYRATATCLIFYVLGVGLLVGVGSVSQVYLFAFSVTTVLLLSLRQGLYAAALSSLSLFAIGMLGRAAPEMVTPHWSSSFTEWAVITLNFSIVNIMLTLAVGAVLHTLNTALTTEIGSRISLDAERNTLRTLIDALPDLIFTKDTSGRFTKCNAATLALFGRDREEEVTGKTVFELFDSREFAEADHADDLDVMAGRRLINREESTFDSKGNPSSYLTIKVPLFDAGGAISGLIGVSRDITALKQRDAEHARLLQVAEAARREREEEKRRSEKEVRDAQARELIAAEANRAKSAFLAMMSHELRTPLNAIIGFSEILVDGKFGPTNERQSRYLKNVLSSGRHLLGLINSLLDLSKIEAGKLEVTRQPCSLRGLAKEALATLRPLADAKQIALIMDDGPVATVVADPIRCKQVLYNFLSNAIKFTPNAGQVTVACVIAPSGHTIRASISDTGPGIKNDDLAHLFQPFQQLEQPELNALGGTGLGLALTKQLVELMGGTVGVESSPGYGSMFFFELPIADVSEHDRVVSPRVTLERPLALIVEDDPAARELLELTLQGDGYQTQCATTGEGALVIARRFRPAVIILDVFLPGIDGWDVLKSLRNSADTSDIPVVMATISNDRQKAFGLGALEHLVKPVDRETLLEALRRHGFTSQVATRAVHVLVVDDDPTHLTLLRAMLEPAGFTVATAETGQAGLEVAKRGPCDLVLLDLGLPDVSGVEIVAALRQHEPTRQLPIFLVTAQDIAPALRARLSDDVQLILSKGNLRLEDLVGEINRAVGRKP